MHRFFKHHVSRPGILSRIQSYTTTSVVVAKATMANPLLEKYNRQLAEKEPGVWETYQHLKSSQQMHELQRDDFLKLRTNLWTAKRWGTEGCILQVLQDMKVSGHAWTIREYNEYFSAKLFQAQYQDILSLFQTDFVETDMKLSIGSFNVILGTYIQLGNIKEAIQLIQEATSRWDVVPDIRDFGRTMSRCMPKNAVVLQQGKELMAQYGFSSIKVLNTNLLHLFRENRISDIQWVMDQQKEKQLDITTYNILIKGYTDARSIRDATAVYKEMMGFNIKPNHYICSSMLTIFAHQRDSISAENVVREYILGGNKPDEVIYNQLIKVYFKSRQLHKAHQAFQEIQKDPTLKVSEIILNTMIHGLVMNNQLQIAGLLYQEMIQLKFKPDMITYNTMLKGYMKSNDIESAIKIVKDMFQQKMEPDIVTYTTLIDCIFKTRQPTNAIEMLNHFTKLNISPNIYSFNAMIHGWIQQNNMKEAENTIQLMNSQDLKPTIHTFTNMIQGYIENNMDLNKAMETFQQLLKSGTLPDRATFNFMILGFINHNRLQDAYSCLEHMKFMKINPTKDTWKLLLDECVLKKDWIIGKKVVNLLDQSGFIIILDSLKRPYSIVKSNCK